MPDEILNGGLPKFICPPISWSPPSSPAIIKYWPFVVEETFVKSSCKSTLAKSVLVVPLPVTHAPLIENAILFVEEVKSKAQPIIVSSLPVAEL